jgi:hypothetical protein
MDPLRVVSALSPSQIDALCVAFLDGLKVLVTNQISDLKKSLRAMDDLAASASNDASKKFEIFGMSCGKINDFHDGLSGRVGELSPCDPSPHFAYLFLCEQGLLILNFTRPWRLNIARKGGATWNSPREIIISLRRPKQSGVS